MPVEGPSYLAGRTDERVLTMFCQVLTIDACGQALKPRSLRYRTLTVICAGRLITTCCVSKTHVISSSAEEGEIRKKYLQ